MGGTRSLPILSRKSFGQANQEPKAHRHQKSEYRLRHYQVRELKCAKERGQDYSAGQTGELISSALISQHGGGDKPGEGGEANGQAGGQIVFGQASKGDELPPISERRFSQSRDAVLGRDDPVVSRDHFAGRAGVLTVDLVQ